MDIYTAGALTAFTKLGFGPADAARMSKVIKKIKLPKASRKMMPEVTEMTPSAMATASKKHMKRDLEGLSNLARHVEGTAELTPVADQLKAQVRGGEALKEQIATKMPSGAIIPSKGNADSVFNHALRDDTQWRMRLNAAPLDPKNKKMLNHIVDGHELDETLVRGGQSARQHGHRSPDVLLREHNRVTTLPKEYQGARDFITKARRHTGEDQHYFASIDPRLAYGKSPRLSRHARKRITELHEQSNQQQMERELEQLKKLFSDT